MGGGISGAGVPVFGRNRVPVTGLDSDSVARVFVFEKHSLLQTLDLLQLALVAVVLVHDLVYAVRPLKLVKIESVRAQLGLHHDEVFGAATHVELNKFAAEEFVDGGAIAALNDERFLQEDLQRYGDAVPDGLVELEGLPLDLVPRATRDHQIQNGAERPNIVLRANIVKV